MKNTKKISALSVVVAVMIELVMVFAGMQVIPQWSSPVTMAAEIEETETEETVAEEIEATAEESGFFVTEMSMTMYVNTDSNVRKGPSTDYERIGSLGKNSEVTVTGQADTGWYQISYQNGTGFISNSLLAEAPVESSPAVSETSQEETAPTAESQTVGTESQPIAEEQQPAESQPQAQPGTQIDARTERIQTYAAEYDVDAATVTAILDYLGTDNMSDYDKAVAVNNYLCGIVTYDDSYSRYCAKNALYEGSAVCQGYANAFCLLMNAAGVQTDYVRGQGYANGNWGSHGWNRSLIEGVYYYTDVTWNDSTESSNYLLISEEQMGMDHLMQSINPSRKK